MTTFLFKEALKKVVDNPEFSDVILEAKESNGEVQVIYASKFVLSLRSEVFRKMLSENSFKEGQTNRIVCSAFNIATMKSLIHYIYTEDIISFTSNDRASSTPETNVPEIKQNMVDFRELTDLYNAGHFYDIQDLTQRITEQARRSENYHEEVEIPSLLYAACHVVDFDTSKFYEYIESYIQHHVLFQTITLEVLEDNVGARYLDRVINETTTAMSGDMCYYWLDLLKGWARQSEEHVLAVQAVMKKISCDSLNTTDLNKVYEEDRRIMSSDVAIEKFRVLALRSKEKLDEGKKELNKEKKELNKVFMGLLSYRNVMLAGPRSQKVTKGEVAKKLSRILNERSSHNC